MMMGVQKLGSAPFPPREWTIMLMEMKGQRSLEEGMDVCRLQNQQGAEACRLQNMEDRARVERIAK